MILTDEMIERAAKAAYERQWPGGVWSGSCLADDFRENAKVSLTAALPLVEAEIQSQNWSKLAGAAEGGRQGGRLAGLREAAEEADRIAGNFKDFERDYRRGAGAAASAIRSLIERG